MLLSLSLNKKFTRKKLNGQNFGVQSKRKNDRQFSQRQLIEKTGNNCINSFRRWGNDLGKTDVNFSLFDSLQTNKLKVFFQVSKKNMFSHNALQTSIIDWHFAQSVESNQVGLWFNSLVKPLSTRRHWWILLPSQNFLFRFRWENNHNIFSESNNLKFSQLNFFSEKPLYFYFIIPFLGCLGLIYSSSFQNWQNQKITLERYKNFLVPHRQMERSDEFFQPSFSQRSNEFFQGRSIFPKFGNKSVSVERLPDLVSKFGKTGRMETLNYFNYVKALESRLFSKTAANQNYMGTYAQTKLGQTMSYKNFQFWWRKKTAICFNYSLNSTDSLISNNVENSKTSNIVTQQKSIGGKQNSSVVERNEEIVNPNSDLVPQSSDKKSSLKDLWREKSSDSSLTEFVSLWENYLFEKASLEWVWHKIYFSDIIKKNHFNIWKKFRQNINYKIDVLVISQKPQFLQFSQKLFSNNISFPNNYLSQKNSLKQFKSKNQVSLKTKFKPIISLLSGTPFGVSPWKDASLFCVGGVCSDNFQVSDSLFLLMNGNVVSVRPQFRQKELFTSFKNKYSSDIEFSQKKEELNWYNLFGNNYFLNFLEMNLVTNSEHWITNLKKSNAFQLFSDYLTAAFFMDTITYKFPEKLNMKLRSFGKFNIVKKQENTNIKKLNFPILMSGFISDKIKCKEKFKQKKQNQWPIFSEFTTFEMKNKVETNVKALKITKNSKRPNHGETPKGVQEFSHPKKFSDFNCSPFASNRYAQNVNNYFFHTVEPLNEQLKSYKWKYLGNWSFYWNYFSKFYGSSLIVKPWNDLTVSQYKNKYSKSILPFNFFKTLSNPLKDSFISRSKFPDQNILFQKWHSKNKTGFFYKRITKLELKQNTSRSNYSRIVSLLWGFRAKYKLDEVLQYQKSKYYQSKKAQQTAHQNIDQNSIDSNVSKQTLIKTLAKNRRYKRYVSLQVLSTWLRNTLYFRKMSRKLLPIKKDSYFFNFRKNNLPKFFLGFETKQNLFSDNLLKDQKKFMAIEPTYTSLKKLFNDSKTRQLSKVLLEIKKSRKQNFFNYFGAYKDIPLESEEFKGFNDYSDKKFTKLKSRNNKPIKTSYTTNNIFLFLTKFKNLKSLSNNFSEKTLSTYYKLNKNKSFKQHKKDSKVFWRNTLTNNGNVENSKRPNERQLTSFDSSYLNPSWENSTRMGLPIVVGGTGVAQLSKKKNFNSYNKRSLKYSNQKNFFLSNVNTVAQFDLKFYDSFLKNFHNFFANFVNNSFKYQKHLYSGEKIFFTQNPYHETNKLNDGSNAKGVNPSLSNNSFSSFGQVFSLNSTSKKNTLQKKLVKLANKNGRGHLRKIGKTVFVTNFLNSNEKHFLKNRNAGFSSKETSNTKARLFVFNSSSLASKTNFKFSFVKKISCFSNRQYSHLFSEKLNNLQNSKLYNFRNEFQDINVKFKNLSSSLVIWRNKFHRPRDYFLLSYMYIDYLGTLLNSIKSIVFGSLNSRETISLEKKYSNLFFLEQKSVLNQKYSLLKNNLIQPQWSFSVLYHLKKNNFALYQQLQEFSSKQFYDLGGNFVHLSNLDKNVDITKQQSDYKFSKLIKPNWENYRYSDQTDFSPEKSERSLALKELAFVGRSSLLSYRSLTDSVISERFFVKNKNDVFLQNFDKAAKVSSNFGNFDSAKQNKNYLISKNSIQNSLKKVVLLKNQQKYLSLLKNLFYLKNSNLKYRRKTGIFNSRILSKQNKIYNGIFISEFALGLPNRTINFYNLSFKEIVFWSCTILFHVCLVSSLFSHYKSSINLCFKTLYSSVFVLNKYFVYIKYRIKRLISYIYQSNFQNITENLSDLKTKFGFRFAQSINFHGNFINPLYTGKNDNLNSKLGFKLFSNYLNNRNDDRNEVINDKGVNPSFSKVVQDYNDKGVEINSFVVPSNKVTSSFFLTNIFFNLHFPISFKVNGNQFKSNILGIFHYLKYKYRHHVGETGVPVFNETNLVNFERQFTQGRYPQRNWENSSKPNNERPSLLESKTNVLKQKNLKVYLKVLQWNMLVTLLIGESELLAELEPYREMHWYFLKKFPIFLRTPSGKDYLGMVDYQADEKIRVIKQKIRQTIMIIYLRSKKYESKLQNRSNMISNSRKNSGEQVFSEKQKKDKNQTQKDLKKKILRQKIQKISPWKSILTFLGKYSFMIRYATLNKRFRESLMTFSQPLISFGPLGIIFFPYIMKNFVSNFDNRSDYYKKNLTKNVELLKLSNSQFQSLNSHSKIHNGETGLRNWENSFRPFNNERSSFRRREAIKFFGQKNFMPKKFDGFIYSLFDYSENYALQFPFEFLINLQKLIKKYNTAYSAFNTSNKTFLFNIDVLNRGILQNFLNKTTNMKRKNTIEENVVNFSLFNFSSNKNLYDWSFNNRSLISGKQSIYFDTFDPKLRYYRFSTNFSKVLSDVGGLNNNFSVHNDFGPLICRVYTGLFSKEFAKNYLLVSGNSISNSENILFLVQALAGEIGLKLFMEDAKRLQRIGNRGINKATKRLEKLFDIAQANVPALIFIEDIHVIGSKTKMIKVDEEQDDVEILARSLLSKLVYRKFHKTKSLREAYMDQHLFKGNSGSSPVHRSLKPVNPIPKSLVLYQLTRRKSFSNFFKNQNNSYKRLPTKVFLRSKLSPTFTTNAVLIWKLFKSKIATPNKRIKETPWYHIPVDAMRSIHPLTYSIRVKVAKITLLAIFTMGTRLRLVKDLIKLFEKTNYNSHQNFIVFATTNKVSSLDPSLRRPGRLEETISLSSVTSFSSGSRSVTSMNTLNTFQILLKNVPGFSKTFNLIDNTLFSSNLQINEWSLINYLAEDAYRPHEQSSLLSFGENLTGVGLSSIVPFDSYDSCLSRNVDLISSEQSRKTLSNQFITVNKKLFKNNQIINLSNFKGKQFSNSNFNENKIFTGKSRSFKKFKNVGYQSKRTFNAFMKYQRMTSFEAKNFDFSSNNSSNTTFTYWQILFSNIIFQRKKGFFDLKSPNEHKLTEVNFSLFDSNLFVNFSKNKETSFEKNKRKKDQTASFNLFLSSAYSRAGQNLMIKMPEEYTDIVNCYNNSQKNHKSFIFDFDHIHNLQLWAEEKNLKPIANNIFYNHRKRASSKSYFLRFFSSKIGELLFKNKIIWNGNTAINSVIKDVNSITLSGRKTEKATKNLGGGSELFSNSKNFMGTFSMSNFLQGGVLNNTYNIKADWTEAYSYIKNTVTISSLYSKSPLLLKLLHLEDVNKPRQKSFFESLNAGMLFEYYDFHHRAFFKKNNVSNEETLNLLILQKYMLNNQGRPLRKYVKLENSNRLWLFRILFTELGSLDNISLRATSMNYYYHNKISLKQIFKLSTYQWWNWHLRKPLEQLDDVQDIAYFPCGDKYYNPRHRRWMLTNGFCSYWFSFDKNFYFDLYEQYMFESFQTAYLSLDEHREILDYLAKLFISQEKVSETELFLIFNRYKSKS